jgi:hypothetical protein
MLVAATILVFVGLSLIWLLGGVPWISPGSWSHEFSGRRLSRRLYLGGKPTAVIVSRPVLSGS